MSLEDFIGDGPLLFPPVPRTPGLAEGMVESAEPVLPDLPAKAPVSAVPGSSGGPAEPDRQDKPTASGIPGSYLSVVCDLGLEKVSCRVAPSCLIAPQAGDRVLVCRGASSSYVLSVLERTGPGTVMLPESTRIQCGDLTVASDTLHVVNSETEVRAARFTLKGMLARVDFTFLTLKARQFVRLAVHFLSRSKASREEAEEAMRISAPDLRLDASETLRARAGTVDLKAEGVAKMDGSTVQLG
jgi:hypothetical protein